MPERDSNTVNSLIHLYRGELGRMVSYRIRLDTTTNWAIVVAAGVTTFAIGDTSISHAVFLFGMILVYAFLHLEARRFRIYEMSHRRVRILETYFFGEMLGEGLDASWRERLGNSLKYPRPPLSHLSAIGWRLRRNYLWIYAALILAWAVKLDFMGGKATTTAEFASRAGLGPFPGWVVVLLVLLAYLAGALLAAGSSLRDRLEPD